MCMGTYILLILVDKKQPPFPCANFFPMFMVNVCLVGSMTSNVLQTHVKVVVKLPQLIHIQLLVDHLPTLHKMEN